MATESAHADRIYLITGAASGMGLATARYLLSQGAKIAATEINDAQVSEVYKDIASERILKLQLDVTKKDNVQDVITQTIEKFGRLDGIANFAGTGGRRLGLDYLWDTDPEEAGFILTLNVKGLFNVLHEALQPGRLTEPGGSIVHIASMFAERGYHKGAVFSASKHAASGMVKSAAMEAGERNIRINCVLPGAIETPMFHAVGSSGAADPTGPTPINRPGRPEEVARVSAFLLGPESSFVTGSTWRVDGGANS